MRISDWSSDVCSSDLRHRSTNQYYELTVLVTEGGLMAVRGLDRGQRAALVISECQNAITNPGYDSSPLIEQVETRGIIPRIASLADSFRDAGLPVLSAPIPAPDGFSSAERRAGKERGRTCSS